MTYLAATQLNTREMKRSVPINNVTALTAADTVNGNKFSNDPGRTFLRFKNTGGSPVTVTIDTPGTVDNLAVADLTATVGATTGDISIGPFTGYYHQPGTSDIFFTVSGACTVDAFHLSTE